jgi:hypothetical protein
LFGLGFGLFYVTLRVGRAVAAMNANAVRMIVSGQAPSFGPGFFALESWSVVPPVPAMPSVDCRSGASCQLLT